MLQRAWIAALGLVIWLGLAAAGLSQQAASPKQDQQLAERDRLWKEAQAARDAGKWADAIRLGRAVVDLEAQLLGPEHQELLSTWDLVGGCAERAEDWGAAETARDAALRIAKAVYPAGDYRLFEARFVREHLNLLRNLTAAQRKRLRELEQENGRVEQLYRQGRYADAIALGKTRLADVERLLGPEHPDTATGLNNLAGMYQVQGHYAAAEPLYHRALKIYEKALGPEHPLPAACFNNLAELYRTQGQYAAAELLYRRALKIYEEALGPEHLNTATCLNNLAELYRTQGNYAAAEPLYRRALKIYEKALGPEHQDTARGLNNLATLYYSQGNYTAAEPLYQRALKTWEKSLGPEHQDTARGLNNLAELYVAQGNYAAAEPLLRRALKIYEKALGPEHPDTAGSLNNLAGLYREQGNYAAAEPLYQRALKIYEKKLGSVHPLTATCLNNLALLYESQENYAAAEPLYQRALKIREKALGPEHPSTAGSLNNLALLYESQGHYAAAEPLLQRALRIREKVLGPEHPGTAGSRHNLALLCWQHLDPSRARPLAEQSLVKMREHLEQTAAIQSEQQQLLMAQQGDNKLSAWLTIGSRTMSPQDDWTLVIPWKGLVTARETLLRRDLKDDPTLAEYRQITQQLSRVAITPPPYPSVPKQLPAWEARREQWQAEKKRLEEAYEQLEKELAKKSSAFAQSKARHRVTAEEITARLAQQPRPTALIDLYPYSHWGQGEEKSEDRLAAFVARGNGRVARVNLGDLKTIQTALANWRATLGRGADGNAAGMTLRERLWLPLEAELKDIEVVLISPDGQLAQLPWGALPGAKPGTYLIEERAFAVLPIPQFLPELAGRKQVLGAPRSLLVAADIDYDGASTTPADPLVARTAIGRLNPDGELRKFPRLRAAKDEADAILQRFRKASPEVEPLWLTGAAATEDAVRHAVEQEEWLHLITHGYFAPESIKSALQVAQQDRERFSRLDRTEPVLRGPHPGVLSGLAFAGANRPPEAGKDDGILTALDVSGLDLRKVDTVVLSACETGLGEVAGGEGLLGLQRAFQVAGAKTCVASLWSVDDAGTRVFMQRFYENLWDKKLARLDALREAQLWVLRHPKEFLAQFNESERRAMKARGGLEFLSSETENIGDATPPFYWAAFVLSGDWR